MKNFLKCNFGYRNDRISLKNDDSPGESFPLTYFQSKSSTNLPQTEFWKKCHVGGRNDGIWPKNDQPLTESYLLTHFQSKSCTNLSETEFWHTKKMSTETKIFKKCHFGDRNDRISRKNDDSPGESFPLTYFHSKSCTNFPQTEFWRKKKKNDHRNENFQKNAVSQAETMEFGRKMMNLLRGPIYWPISNRKVAPI